MLIPYLYLISAAFGAGITAILRRGYQQKAGSDLTATLLFSTVSSFTAFLLGFFINGGFELEPLSFLLALIYAGLSTFTANLCIVATKYGQRVQRHPIFLHGRTDPLQLLWAAVYPFGYPQFAQYPGLSFSRSGSNGRLRKAGDRTAASKQMRRLQIAIFFTNGMALVVFKLMSMLRPGFDQGGLITEYMLISAAASGIILMLSLAKHGKAAVPAMPEKSFHPIAILIALVYTATFFISDALSMKCTALIPLTMQALLSFCLRILCTALLEGIVYRQKLTKYDSLQIHLAALCSVCFVFG